MFDWLHEVARWLVRIVHEFSYLGIFIMTFVESTFVPLPAEVTMIPAGYLVQQGKMDFITVFLASVFGTVGGAYANYWIAKRYGRDLFLRYPKIFMMNESKLDKLEKFFQKHGAISTFTGRLIPGIRHYISFPAGLARMDLKKFFFFTGLGGAIWMFVLLMVGYHIGENEELMKKYLPLIKLTIMGLAAIGITFYAWRSYKKTTENGKS